MTSQYAKIGEVKPGDVLIADGGFTCLENGDRRVVMGEPGHLWITCKHGSHCLDGQNKDGRYVGLTLAEPVSA